jgi:hypothetical protein
MSKRMSRENQKLIYWFIDCYAYHLKGVDINWHTSKQKSAISDYFLYKAKEDLKKLYIRHSGKNIKGYEPFRNMENKLKDRIGNIIDKNYTKESKINIITNDLMDFVTDEIQMLFIKLNDTFSLALKLMSNVEAVAFTNFLFDYFLQNDIDMWQEIHELYRQQENRKWVYWMLKKKICVITGKPNAQLAHISKSAGALGGYKYDKGIGNSYLTLAAEWHIGVDHGVNGGRNKLISKLKELNIEPFEIRTEEEVKKLKKIYKGHFKGFKEE